MRESGEGPSGRLFVGVPLPAHAREALVARLRALRGSGGLPGRPVHPRDWHLTLRFLGETDPARGARLVEALRAAPWPAAFEVEIGGGGAFPRPARASVLWVGVAAGADALHDLAAVAEGAARRAGWPAEPRPYRPHLTLARLRPPRDLTGEVSRLHGAGPRMAVDAAVLFRSGAAGGPERYPVLERFPLA